MSFDALMIHRLQAVRSHLSYDTADLDDQGQPTVTSTTETAFRGRVRPLNARERSQYNQAGVTVADHIIYARPVDVIGADYIAFDPDDGRHFQVTGVIDPSYMAHHIEVPATLVIAGGEGS